MDKELIIGITNAAYHLTLLFPKKEPLRVKIRETGTEILAQALKIESLEKNNEDEFKIRELSVDLSANLAIMEGYLSIAIKQNWVIPFELIELQEKYFSLKNVLVQKIRRKNEVSFKEELVPVSEILRQKQETREEPKVSLLSNGDSIAEKTILDERKEKIISFLREKGKVQVWQVNEVMPNISKRTIRRDFHQLLKMGLINRMGESNATFYQLN